MIVKGKWFTYVGPSMNGLKRGQAVRVVQPGFGTWADQAKVAARAGASEVRVPRQVLRGPGTATPQAALARCWVSA